MKTTVCKHALIALLILLLAAPSGVLGQETGTAATFSQEQLNQMLAPIALYPDSLLANILIAATFPLEVVSADRWVKQNKDLQGDAAQCCPGQDEMGPQRESSGTLSTSSCHDERTVGLDPVTR